MESQGSEGSSCQLVEDCTSPASGHVRLNNPCIAAKLMGHMEKRATDAPRAGSGPAA